MIDDAQRTSTFVHLRKAGRCFFVPRPPSSREMRHDDSGDRRRQTKPTYAPFRRLPFARRATVACARLRRARPSSAAFPPTTSSRCRRARITRPPRLLSRRVSRERAENPPRRPWSARTTTRVASEAAPRGRAARDGGENAANSTRRRRRTSRRDNDHHRDARRETENRPTKPTYKTV